MHVERILADPLHFKCVKPVLLHFFESVLLPRLLTNLLPDSVLTSQPEIDTHESNASNKVKKNFLVYVVVKMEGLWPVTYHLASWNGSIILVSVLLINRNRSGTVQMAVDMNRLYDFEFSIPLWHTCYNECIKFSLLLQLYK